MVVLTAMCAALYAAILIPFKIVPMIPGITEFRPANAVPVDPLALEDEDFQARSRECHRQATAGEAAPHDHDVRTVGDRHGPPVTDR